MTKALCAARAGAYIARPRFAGAVMAYRTNGNAHNFRDLTGQRFGRLVCLSYSKVQSGTVTKTVWHCRCDCGAEASVRLGELRTGDAKSCGCLRREVIGDAKRTHGGTGTREHWIWLSMIQRCTNKKNKGYENYGGRGIKVCERWRNSFEAFLEDIGPRPSLQHSIERKDNDGPYAPENCIWAKRATQNRNKRDTVVTPEILAELREVRARGESVKEWAAKRGISYSTARKSGRKTG